MTDPGDGDRLQGALLGTALGDALGLPMEGLDGAEIALRFDLPVRRFHLLGRRGFVSDDTEQTALVAEALLCGHGDIDATVRHFRRGLRAWFLRLPFGIQVSHGQLQAPAQLGEGPDHPIMQRANAAQQLDVPQRLLKELLSLETFHPFVEPRDRRGVVAVCSDPRRVPPAGLVAFRLRGLG